ncbi:MAG: Na/Pi cotransporter family protein, partial [bacterium]
TAVSQSSSVTTVMCVSFVAAGLMSFSQSMGLILGANIGTTITAQLVAFKVTKYAMFLVAGGVLLQMISKGDKTKQWGRVVLGLGLLFVGMNTMGDAMKPLRTYEPFIELMQQMANPLLGMLVSAIFTALVQSSSATMGVVIALATQQLISFPAGLALILGANVGTCVTAGLSVIGRSTEAKRVAGAHVFFNLGGAILVLPFLGLIANVIGPGNAESADLTRAIANAHTFFNIGMAILFLPFLTFIANFLTKIISQEKVEAKAGVYVTALEPDLLNAPSLAMAAVTKELEHLGKLVLMAYRDSLPTLLSDDPKQLKILKSSDDEIDKIHNDLISYLTELGRKPLSPEQQEEQMRLVKMADELEQIGDVLETNISRLIEQKQDSKVNFDSDSTKLLSEYHAMTLEALEKTVTALDSEKNQTAEPVIDMKKKLKAYAEKAHSQEAKRLETMEGGGLLVYRLEVDMIEKMEQVFRHSRRLARHILKLEKSVLAT